MADDNARRRIGELEDEIKRRDERIAELRQEVDDTRVLLRQMQEALEDYDNVIDRWRETFEMVQTETGAWTWAPFWDEHNTLIDEYNDLVHKWNRYLPIINQSQQPVGRPLAASEAQVATVRKLRKAGKSLRWIAEETSLGLNTVRTIVGKISGTDRTTRMHRQRIEIDRQQATHWKRRKRSGNALPKQAQQIVEQGRELVKEAKGLK